MSNATLSAAQDFLISTSIQMTINGVDFEGYLETSFHNIKTTITKPFKNLYECWHIPYFAQSMTYHGKLGERSGQSSLKNLYLLADYVHQKEDVLKRKYQEFEARKAEILEEERIWLLEGNFFEEHFPMSVSGSKRESVIAILEGKKSLV